MWTYRFQVERVVDGDTIWGVADLGFYVSLRMALRLNGIDAPELHGVADTKPGEAAKEWLKSAVEGKQVVIQTYKDKKEKYGRFLADVYTLEDSTKSVNQHMVELGYAKPYDGGPRQRDVC